MAALINSEQGTLVSVNIFYKIPISSTLFFCHSFAYRCQNIIRMEICLPMHAISSHFLSDIAPDYRMARELKDSQNNDVAFSL